MSRQESQPFALFKFDIVSFCGRQTLNKIFPLVLN